MTELPLVARLRVVAEKQRHERGDYLTLGNSDAWLTEAADIITELAEVLLEARYYVQLVKDERDLKGHMVLPARIDAVLAKARAV